MDAHPQGPFSPQDNGQARSYGDCDLHRPQGPCGPEHGDSGGLHPDARSGCGDVRAFCAPRNRLLEGEGLIESTLGSGKRTQYRFVERLQIVNSEGTPVASVEWQFLPLAWKENLNRALQAAMGQLETGAPINATINVGTINVLIVPGRSDD